MEKELKYGLIAALEGKPSNNFSAEDVNDAAITAICKEIGLSERPSARELRAHEAEAFSLVEEAVDEILPKKLAQVLGEFAEVKTFNRDDEVVFDIEKIGKGRAKLVITEGARSGIYRAARLDSKYFSVNTKIKVAAVYVTLEELIMGKMSLAELFNNILEGFEEIVYKDVFNALASGKTALVGAGTEKYNATSKGSVNITTNGDALVKALDEVLPIVKQYGIPTIFGSYGVLSKIYNPVAGAAGHYSEADSLDIRNHGYVQIYKGNRVIELPNYLIDNSNKEWFYDEKTVFVIPSGIKPVKVALKGEMYIQKNTHAVGSEKWEANKMMGVGVAMANSYAVIKVE